MMFNYFCINILENKVITAMKNRNAINNHPQSRKGVSNRVITQQNQLNEKKIENSNNSAKEKDENLKSLVK